MSEEENDPREDLLKKHRKEKKDLQAQIQALKKSASKGDKKKKKELVETIATLEANLNEKHKTELEVFDNANSQPTTNGTSALPAEDKEVAQVSDDEPLGPLPIKEEYVRLTKAQKRREKKASKEKERQEEIEKQEEINKSGPRALEAQSIQQKLVEKRLKSKEIPSDGDCMFSGVVDQLAQLSIQSSVGKLRSDTAEELRAHPDHYHPFLYNPSTGDMMTNEEYEKYCDRIKNTPAWGGQIELKALSKLLARPIQVIQGTGPEIVLGEEYKEEPIILTYHRHLHGLGEHYNSVTKLL